MLNHLWEDPMPQDLIFKLMFLEDLMVSASLDEKGRELIFVNDLFCKTTGFEKSEVIGRNCSFLQGADTDPAHKKAIREGFDNDHIVFQDILNYKKNRVPFINRLIIFSLKVQSKRFLVGLQTIRHVVTKEKPTPELLGMSDIELSHADLNHYLRNPLTIFQSASEEAFKEGIHRMVDFVSNLDNVKKYPPVY